LRLEGDWSVGEQLAQIEASMGTGLLTTACSRRPSAAADTVR